MKKTILAILAMTMILSSVASAGILDKIFGQGNELTGAPTAVEKNIMMTPKYSGFKGSFTQNTYLKPNALSTLPNGVTVKTSSYDEHNMHITLLTSKTMTVSNNQVVRLDDGEYIVTMKNMPLTPMGISIKRKGKALGVKASTAQHSLIMKGLFEQSTFVPYGKQVKLASGFVANAEKSGSGYGKLVISKSVYLANNDKVSLTDRMLEVTIDSTGVRFHTPHNSPTAFNVGQNKITGAPTAAEVRTIQNLEEIAILQLGEATQPAQLANLEQEQNVEFTTSTTSTAQAATIVQGSQFKASLTTVQMAPRNDQSTVTTPGTIAGQMAEAKTQTVTAPGQISTQAAEVSLPCKDPFVVGKIIDYGKPIDVGNGFTATMIYDTVKKQVKIEYKKMFIVSQGQYVKTGNGHVTTYVTDKGVYFERGKKKLPVSCLYDKDCRSSYKCLLPNTEISLNEKPGVCSMVSQLKGKSEACTLNTQCLSGSCIAATRKCSAIVEGDLCATVTGVKACSSSDLKCVKNRCKKQVA